MYHIKRKLVPNRSSASVSAYSTFENTDSQDFEALLVNSKRLSIEHHDGEYTAAGDYETVESGPNRHYGFDNAVSSPSRGDHYLAAQASLGWKENNVLHGCDFTSNNETNLVSQTTEALGRALVENQSREDAPTSRPAIENAESAPTFYEYLEITVQPHKDVEPYQSSTTVFLLSERTIGRALNQHRDLMLRTGSPIDCFSSASVGPISRMLRDWFIRHTKARIYGFQRSLFDVLGDTTGNSFLRMAFEKPGLGFSQASHLSRSPHAGACNYKTKKRPESQEWKLLFDLFLWSDCICSHFFSPRPSDDLFKCWDTCETHISQIPKSSKQAIESMRRALSVELTYALPGCWEIKAARMLEKGDMEGADLTLKHAFLSSTPENCNKIRDGILLEHWRRYTRWEEGASHYTIFDILRSYERPAKQIQSVVDSYRNWWFQLRPPTFSYLKPSPVLDHSMNRYNFDIKKLSGSQLQRYHTFLHKRLTATKGNQYIETITEIDDLLLSFYPGIAEIKRWFAIKALLMAKVQNWLGSTNIIRILELEEEPLDWKDDYNTAFYLAQAMNHLRDKRFLAAEISCYRALQYRDIPECGRDEIRDVMKAAFNKQRALNEVAEPEVETVGSQIMHEAYGGPLRLAVSVGINITDGGQLKAPVRVFQEAMVSSLLNLDLARVLFTDLSWVEEVSQSEPLNWQVFFPASLSFPKPSPPATKLPDGYFDPIYFYGNRNRADILEIIVEAYKQKGQTPLHLSSARRAKAVLTQAFYHAAGTTVQFLIRNVPGLNINELMPKDSYELGVRRNRLHCFIGREPSQYTSDAEYPNPAQERALENWSRAEVNWVVDIKRGLTTAQLEPFFRILKELNVNPKISYGSTPTLELATSNLETLEQSYYDSLSASPAIVNLARHDLIIGYYCVSWLITFPLKPDLIRKANKVLTRVDSVLKLLDRDCKLPRYPEYSIENTPYPNVHYPVNVRSINI